MSFSSDVKDELCRQLSASRHCQLAELAAILGFLGRIQETDKGQGLVVHMENVTLARKYFTLLKRIFNINATLRVSENPLHKGKNCMVAVTDQTQAFRILHAVKWIDSQGQFVQNDELVSGLLVKNACCKRAFIRGAFLASGSMSDPEKAYHFEIVCQDLAKARQLRELITSFGLDAKIVARKKCHVVYLKEGAQIVDMLNVMEAHVALMNLENVRILKEMRNSVNRQVNCETANINKTVNAAIKQVEDIQYIEQTVGLSVLSESLKEMAQLRLAYPEAALKELGNLLTPTVGKSGVNHRLRKISSFAEELRERNACI